ncbi:MAG: hypothetical protein HW388_1321 [Dehalococcoidia bacterium]|nr:hypothetical protein [Dehalococcoidia bacterium]
MSKLIDRLEKVGTAASNPMGFGANRTVEKAPPLLLIALSGMEPPKSLSQIQADSLIIATPQVEKEGLEAAKVMAEDTIWGVWPETLTSDSPDVLKEEGGDFFICSPGNTPDEVLAGEELGRILAIPVDFPEELGRSLEGLPVDALLLTGLEEASPLSLGDLLQICSMRDLTSKPMLLLRSHGLNQGELAVLQDAGIQAVVLDLRAVKGKEATQMQEAISGLPPRKTKRDSASPVLPRPSSRALSPGRRDDDDDDNNDDDEDDF